ncbi:hypothetical protein FXV83_21900 [Bradyrhizobium hipponense]|uniref:Transposase IS801/IS1294 domain-containing protein n=1 Tax=Bradyrhizobium hipponense TaxID=2605638 RepID=A0A5S4YJX2_9BRAD|nr:hypothetical protein FXV83_21900 [Bradyrhizobium hipponense]
MEGLPHRRSRAIQADDARYPTNSSGFLMHVLPQSFHRIRYYGWLAS